MRGKISDQDLTNYALNDGLEPRERLYVESMLGLSEECRGDVYRMLELSQMLEAGFERESAVTLMPSLTSEQRARLTSVQPVQFSPYRFVQKTAAALALAACVAFALVHMPFWNSEARTLAMKRASVMMSEAMAANEEMGLQLWMNPPTMEDDEEGNSLMKVSSESTPAPTPAETICTPPTWSSVVEQAGMFSEVH